jgi:hypothetical protein
MANIKTWLLEAEQEFGEEIEAIVVGKHYNMRWSEPAAADENVILNREAGLAKLDQEYDHGFGGAYCYPMYAWTKSRVFWMEEYDGATGPSWTWRNPTATEPKFGGQSL